jgi:signal transduction histidine kinase
LYNNLGDYNNAMACHLKALRFFEEAGNKLGESFCYNSIAVSYYKLKQYGNAAEHAQKSLALKKSLKDNRGVCVSELQLGEIYRSMGNTQQAFKRFETALKMAREEKMLTEEATCYLNMAKIFTKLNKDSLAIIYLKKTRAIASQLGNKEFAANADAELAALNNNTGNLKQTEAALVTSSNTFKESGSLNEEANNYKRLSDFYASTKQYDKALAYLDKYHEIKDSIAGANVQVQLKNMEGQYNSTKKENEIMLLKKDKELQQQQLSKQRLLMIGAAILALLALGAIVLLVNRNRLRQRMKELELRNRIAADLHDEVGSSLSSIHMLSQMATKSATDTAQKDILVRMSRNTSETMDRMGDLVWMIKPGETEGGSLKQRMERFTYEICSSKNISASLQLDELEGIKLTMEQRKNIYLVFKEAVNNAVKYSGTEKVEVTASLQNKELILQVKDFGKGFDSSIVKKGNGLDNMQHRANELGGILRTETTINTGTTIQLVVPV